VHPTAHILRPSLSEGSPLLSDYCCLTSLLGTTIRFDHCGEILKIPSTTTRSYNYSPISPLRSPLGLTLTFFEFIRPQLNQFGWLPSILSEGHRFLDPARQVFQWAGMYWCAIGIQIAIWLHLGTRARPHQCDGINCRGRNPSHLTRSIILSSFGAGSSGLVGKSFKHSRAPFDMTSESMYTFEVQ
jgi:hypothetical protein